MCRQYTTGDKSSQLKMKSYNKKSNRTEQFLSCFPHETIYIEINGAVNIEGKTD